MRVVLLRMQAGMCSPRLTRYSLLAFMLLLRMHGDVLPALVARAVKILGVEELATCECSSSPQDDPGKDESQLKPALPDLLFEVRQLLTSNANLLNNRRLPLVQHSISGRQFSGKCGPGYCHRCEPK